MGNKLLELGTDQAVAKLGRCYLKEAATALPRVHDATDVEGLHDFRVALRRLRSVLHSYRGDFHGGFDKPLYRQLGDLARRTNSARDIEVMLVWIEGEIPHLTPAQRKAANWWHEQLQTQAGEAYAHLEDHLEEGFAAIAKPFRKWFRQMDKSPRDAHGFAHVTAQKLRQLIDELALLLTVIRSMDDMPTLHQARIVGKRLRYLIGPLSKGCPPCKAAAGVLKEFQELLGGLHDCHVRDLALRQASAEAAAAWARERIAAIAAGGPDGSGQCRELNGLGALARRNRAEAESLFGRFHREHLANNASELASRIELCIQTLGGA